jgi:hypothetical protein
MTDVVFIVLAIALFTACAGYIGACERLTRTQDQTGSDQTIGDRS